MHWGKGAMPRPSQLLGLVGSSISRECKTLADGLARYLSQLGLERRHKLKTLHDLFSGDDPNTDNPATVNGNGKADCGNDGVND